MKSRIELNQDKQIAIDEEEQKEKNKKILKRILKIVLILFLLITCFCFYTVNIATTSLIVKEEQITSDKLPAGFHGLKIIQFSDLHYQNKELLEDVINNINLRKPDLLFFTGDLLKENEDLSTEDRTELLSKLKEIEANIGKYAVLGETDDDVAKAILTDAGFEVLDNQSKFVYTTTNERISVIGINTNQDQKSIESFLNTYKESNQNTNYFTILLLHKPDYIDYVLPIINVDLAFAGHSHLGELNLFGLYPVTKKDGATKYTRDFYQLENTRFYISSGIGTDLYDFRLGARPSITYLRVVKEV